MTFFPISYLLIVFFSRLILPSFFVFLPPPSSPLSPKELLGVCSVIAVIK